ncbi:MAG TPA: amidohydrolase family protein [Candidatus Binataceae bacterium]|nr:amidohydrolase family protein [Candidatus Binataceae bacterium]
MDAAESFVVDCDSHVMEPPDLWEKYLEPKFRERAIKIAKDPVDGIETLSVDNQPILRGVLAGLGGANRPRHELFNPGKLGYMDGCPPASYLPGERIKLLDEWGVNAGVLFPTVGILWDVADNELAAAYARAYNNWIVDFASGARSRVIPIAHLALQDVPSALEELRRCLKLGFKGIFLAPETIGGRRFSHPDFDPIWRECEAAGIPACLHVIVRFNRAPGVVRDFYQTGEFRAVYGFALGGFGQVVPAAMTMIADGLFDRFPRLKVVCVEAGCGWAPYFMDRLDQKYELLGWTYPTKLKPSDYFRRNLWVVAEPEERMIGTTMELMGEDRVLWGSDFPHIDSKLEAPQLIRHSIAGLSPERRRKLLGENAKAVFPI